MHFIRLNSKQIGNLLITTSVLCLVVTYAPLMQLYLKPQSSNRLQKQLNEDTISIPKIDASAKLIYNVNPWIEKDYEKSLSFGVAHALGTPLPGEGETSYLFAHSSLPLWKMTRTNTPFLLLGRLTEGDRIYINRANRTFEFETLKTQEVWPNEVSYLIHKTEGVSLILQTCSPLGTTLKRLLVFAKLV